jgi:hypothetical protein
MTDTNKCISGHRWGHVRGRPSRCMDCNISFEAANTSEEK